MEEEFQEVYVHHLGPRWLVGCPVCTQDAAEGILVTRVEEVEEYGRPRNELVCRTVHWDCAKHYHRLFADAYWFFRPRV